MPVYQHSPGHAQPSFFAASAASSSFDIATSPDGSAGDGT